MKVTFQTASGPKTEMSFVGADGKQRDPSFFEDEGPTSEEMQKLRDDLANGLEVEKLERADAALRGPLRKWTDGAGNVHTESVDETLDSIIKKHAAPQIGIDAWQEHKEKDAADKSILFLRKLSDVRESAVRRAADGKWAPDDFAARWFKLGFPTFELTASLSAAICMTECRGLKGRDYRMPFDAIAIQMPTNNPLLFRGREVRFILASDRFSFSLVWDDATDPCPVAVFDSGVGPQDDQSIDAWIASVGTPEHAHVVRFFVNACVYINSLSALPAQEGKRINKPGASAPQRKATAPTHWVLGREIKLSKGMLQAARVEHTSGVSAVVKRLHVRFTVRGHYRFHRGHHQQHGCSTPEHCVSSRKWITPYWKGPELAEGLARLYSAE